LSGGAGFVRQLLVKRASKLRIYGTAKVPEENMHPSAAGILKMGTAAVAHRSKASARRGT
jgi:hypothetical protein